MRLIGKITVVATGAVVAVAIVLVVLFGFKLARDFRHVGGRGFNAQEWRAHPGHAGLSGQCESDNPRGAMVDDLMGKNLEARMTRIYVRKLPGRPDRGEKRGSWDYCLGMWSGFRVDYDWLSLDFG